MFFRFRHLWALTIAATSAAGQSAPANPPADQLRHANLSSGSTDTLSSADRAAILALDSMFVSAWLRDDTSGVLGVFAPDAVLQPPGAREVIGVAAIRSYWFPRDGSVTRILAFDHQVMEVLGSSTLAVVRGASTLRWRYTKDGKSAEQSGRSSDLRVYAADPSGKWRVIRQMWVALP